MIDLRLLAYDLRDVRGAKPHCSDHVLEHPYAARVSRAWDARLAAAKGGELSPELIADARQAVQELGTITTSRLARVLDVDGAGLELVVQRLLRDGAAPGRTRRGATTLTAPARWGERKKKPRPNGRRPGRRPPGWTHVTLGEVLRWVDQRQPVSVLGFGRPRSGAAQLAELVGCSKSLIWSWRHGKTVPGEHLQRALAAVVRSEHASGAA